MYRFSDQSTQILFYHKSSIKYQPQTGNCKHKGVQFFASRRKKQRRNAWKSWEKMHIFSWEKAELTESMIQKMYRIHGTENVQNPWYRECTESMVQRMCRIHGTENDTSVLIEFQQFGRTEIRRSTIFTFWYLIFATSNSTSQHLCRAGKYRSLLYRVSTKEGTETNWL